MATLPPCRDHRQVPYQADRGHGAERLRAGFRRALLPPDRGLRRLRFSGIARGELRPAGLCLGLAQMPLPRRLRRRHPQQPADGFLRPALSWFATPGSTGFPCGRPTSTIRTGTAPSKRPKAVAGRTRCASASARSRAWRRRTPKRSTRPATGRPRRPFADPADLRDRSGLPVSVLETLAGADAFGSTGRTRRQALWAVPRTRPGAAPALRRRRRTPVRARDRAAGDEPGRGSLAGLRGDQDVAERPSAGADARQADGGTGHPGRPPGRARQRCTGDGRRPRSGPPASWYRHRA